jgi:peptide/nickel transport system substrate-binding protein
MAGHPETEPYPEQDLEKAKQLIAESGVTPGKVTIWCMTSAGGSDTAQYVQGVLNDLGFTARTRCLDFSAYYNVVGVKNNNTQIGFASWGADYPEGATFIYSNLYGANINPDHSSNYAWYSGADADIEKVMAMTDLDARAKEWARIDTKVIGEDAAWAPLYNGVQRNLLSKRVGDYVFHPLYDFLLMKATVDGSGTNNAEIHAHEVGFDDEGNPVEDGAEGGDES